MTTARAFGLEVIRNSGGEEIVKCPFHNDRHASAWWNPVKNLFWCSVCQIGANIEQLLFLTGNKIDVEAWNEYEEREVPLVSIEPDDYEPRVGAPFYSSYIERRGVSESIALAYGLTVGVVWPDITIPVRNRGGYLTGTITRFIDTTRSKGQRYQREGKMWPVWPMERLQGVIAGEFVLVTEGIFSALRWLSVNSTFCTFSTAGARANRDIAEVLSPFTPIFLYDADGAGRRAARKMRELRPDAFVYTMATAPDDMDDAQLKKLDRWLRREIKHSLPVARMSHAGAT